LEDISPKRLAPTNKSSTYLPFLICYSRKHCNIYDIHILTLRLAILRKAPTRVHSTRAAAATARELPTKPLPGKLGNRTAPGTGERPNQRTPPPLVRPTCCQKSVPSPRWEGLRPFDPRTRRQRQPATVDVLDVRFCTYKSLQLNSHACAKSPRLHAKLPLVLGISIFGAILTS